MSPAQISSHHPSAAVRVAGTVAGQAEQQKAGKYIYEELAATHHFVPVVVETTGVFGPEAHSFLQHIYISTLL